MEQLRQRLSLDIPSFEQIHRDEGSAKPSPSTGSTTADIMMPAMLLKRHAHLHLHHHHHKDHHGRDKGSGSNTPVHQASSSSRERRDEAKGITKILSAKVGRGSLDVGRDEGRMVGQGQTEAQPAEKESGETESTGTPEGRLWNGLQKKDTPLDEAGLMKLRQQRKLKEDTIAQSLSSLSSYSNSTIQQLDTTYYSILSSLSKLQSTLSSLQQLSSATTRLSEHFEGQARELESDVGKDIAAFGELDAQRRKIEGLGERVKKGRERVGDLSQRLENVSEMVKVWERNELEWRAGVRRRLRILWTVISVMLILFVVFYVRNKVLSPGTVPPGNAPPHTILHDNFTYAHGQDEKHAPRYPGLRDSISDEEKDKDREKEEWVDGVFRRLDELA